MLSFYNSCVALSFSENLMTTWPVMLDDIDVALTFVLVGATWFSFFLIYSSKLGPK